MVGTSRRFHFGTTSSLIEECLMAGKSWQGCIEPPSPAKGHSEKRGDRGEVDWKKTVKFKDSGNQLLD